MLNGVDFDVSFGDGRGTVRFRNVFDARFDFRLAFQVHAAKADAAVCRGGQNGHVDPVSAVEAHAGKFGRPVERLLIKHKQIKQNAPAIGKDVEIWTIEDRENETNRKCKYRGKVATLATSLILND